MAPDPLRADPGQHGRPLRNDRNGLLEVNADYFALAANTGGDFYFWAPGEFATARLRIPLSGEPVLLAYGNVGVAQRSFAIPVESGARSLTIFSGAQRKDFAVLVRPDGTIVADGAAGAAIQSFRHMMIATIDVPVAGTWRLEFTGAGTFEVSAHVQPSRGDDALAFDDFDFLEPGGRPGHEGLFPISRELRKGETIPCSATLSGQLSAVQLAFVSPDDQPISTVSMEQDGGGRDYFGRCAIPSRPFQVAVTGRDARGLPFRRVESRVHSPIGN